MYQQLNQCLRHFERKKHDCKFVFRLFYRNKSDVIRCGILSLDIFGKKK